MTARKRASTSPSLLNPWITRRGMKSASPGFRSVRSPRRLGKLRTKVARVDRSHDEEGDRDDKPAKEDRKWPQPPPPALLAFVRTRHRAALSAGASHAQRDCARQPEMSIAPAAWVV